MLRGITSEEMRLPTYSNLASFVGPNSVAQINIPNVPNTFMDPASSWLSFEIVVTATAAANPYVPPANNTAAMNQCMLGSGGWSLFNRVSQYANGTLIDDIMSPNIYVNTWRNLSQSYAEQLGDAAVFGGQDCFVNNPNVGYIIGGQTGTQYAATTNVGGVITQRINFAIPMIGFLGAGSAGHLIPLFICPFRIDLSLEAIANCFCGSTELPIGNVQFTRLEFVTQRINLEDPMMDAVLSALPVRGQIVLRCNQVSTTTVVVPTGTFGSQQYTVGTRVSSAKSFLCTFTQPDLCDKIFGSVNPNMSTFAHEINSGFYPRQFQDLTKSSDAFARNLLAMGIWSSTNGKGSVGLSNWGVAQTANTPAPPFVVARTGADDNTKMDTHLQKSNANCFYLFTDVERFGSKGSGSGFFSGVDVTGGANFLRINFAIPTTALNTIYIFTLHDATINFDIAAQRCTRFI